MPDPALGFPVWDRYSQKECERAPAARKIADRFEVAVRSRAYYRPPKEVKGLIMATTEQLFKEIKTKLGVECVPFAGTGEPYLTAEDMVRDLRETRRHLMRHRNSGPISGHCTMQFRAVHDVYGHCLQEAPFTFSGELLAYTKFVDQYPPACWPFGWNNIVAENSYRLVHGKFLCINYQCSSPFVFDQEKFGCTQDEWERRYPAPGQTGEK